MPLIKLFRNIDWITTALVILLCIIGLAAIYSVEFSIGDQGFLHVKKQLVAFFIGLIMFIAIAGSHHKLLESYIIPVYWGTILLLVAVLFIGETIRGTTGWFSFGGFNFQPVELAKFSTIIALAKYFEWRASLRFTGKAIWQSFIIAALPAGLIFLQPDFGGALLLLFVWFILLIIFGIKKTHFLAITLGTMIVGIVAWFFILEPYQQDRIRTFLNPVRDPQGAGYNVRQSIIAIGSGRFLGRGLGFGSQSQLKFLPESQTDFVFAVIAEELGFVITFTVIAIFGFLLYRFFRSALQARNDFRSFLILGIAVLFFLEFVINVGMNIGIMPVMGIAAPFLSYGGSSLLMHLFMAGVVLSAGKDILRG